MAELRCNDFPQDILDVMDGAALGTGQCRRDIAIQVLGKWAREKKHESIVICRVLGVNPQVKESDRREEDFPASFDQ